MASVRRAPMRRDVRCIVQDVGVDTSVDRDEKPN